MHGCFNYARGIILHGNVVNAPLSEFEKTEDYLVCTMHVNNGVGMNLIKLQRNLKQLMDSKETDQVKSEEKIQLEKDIEEIEELSAKSTIFLKFIGKYPYNYLRLCLNDL